MKLNNCKMMYFDSCLLLFLMGLFGIVSIFLGRDFNWDFRNYHYYNAWAYLNNRLDIDLTPNDGLRAYFCPTLDIIEYLLMQVVSPKIYAFIIGSISGVGCFYSYKLAQLVFTIKFSKKSRLFFIVIAVVLGNTAFANIVQIGTSYNENIVAVIFLVGFYYIVKYNSNNSYKSLWFGSIMLGIAFACKLTVIVYIFSVFILKFLSYKLQSKVDYKKSNLTMLTGFALGSFSFAGFWWVKMIHRFGNPFYPNFNSLLKPKSSINYITYTKEHHFIPSSILHYIAQPFIMMTDSDITSEFPFRDPRFGCLFILIIGYFILRKCNNNVKLQSGLENYLLKFFLLSYVLWEMLFSIARYTIELCYISGILIVLLVINIKIEERIKNIVLLILTVLLISSTIYRIPQWGRVSFIDNITNNQVRISNALIIMPEEPLTYLIPSLGSSNIYIGLPFQKSLSSKWHIEQKDFIIKQAVANKQDIYVVALSAETLAGLDWVAKYNLKLDKTSCMRTGTIINEYICKLV